MTNNSNIINQTTVDFEKRYEGFSDEEITEILKKRNHYREEAVKATVNIAIGRGIINSEEDLFSENFKVEPLRFTLFPPLSSKKILSKTLKSLSRSLIIVGAIPLVWGGYNLYREFNVENLGLVIFGLIWIGFVISLMRKPQQKTANILLLLWTGAVVYLANYLATLPVLRLYDIFFVVVCCILVLYGLLYIRRVA